jgi:hypothetical protein
VSVTAPVRPVEAPPPHDLAIAAAAIERELPDTGRAAEHDGCAMVQAFRVVLPGGDPGRCWVETGEALALPSFGRQWIAAALHARAAAVGADRLRDELTAPGGLRLRPGA